MLKTNTNMYCTQNTKWKSFKHVNIRKAVEPDAIPGCVIRVFSEQLAGMFTDIFNLSLSMSKLSVTPPLCELIVAFRGKGDQLALNIINDSQVDTEHLTWNVHTDHIVETTKIKDPGGLLQRNQ